MAAVNVRNLFIQSRCLSSWVLHKHCLKKVQIRSYFWSVLSSIRTEYSKTRTRNNSVFAHFSGSITRMYLANATNLDTTSLALQIIAATATGKIQVQYICHIKFPFTFAYSGFCRPCFQKLFFKKRLGCVYTSKHAAGTFKHWAEFVKP